MRTFPMFKLIGCLLMAATIAAAAEPAGQESKRLARAKDFIEGERWSQAIDDLQIAIADPKETRKDEALYWLAHSLNQVGDRAGSVEVIRRLEGEYPSSKWVKPAQALRIEIAVRLNRSDVLWYAAMPPPPPSRAPMPVQPDAPPARPSKAAGAPKAVGPKGDGPAKVPPPLPWYGVDYSPDPDLQIQALSALLKTEADRVIPLLNDIVFESHDAGRASRAVFVLSQSDSPKAFEVVLKAAKGAPEPAQIAAVKVLGRSGGPAVSFELLQVYDTAKENVKFQVVRSLSERMDKRGLQHIVQSEKNFRLRSVAIEGLGQAGGVEQLSVMYKSATLPLVRRSIISGLFIARADGELIRICETERNGGDPKLASDVLEKLRLLSTPKAKEYLQKVSEKR
jgi:hypothetical protein